MEDILELFEKLKQLLQVLGQFTKASAIIKKNDKGPITIGQNSPIVIEPLFFYKKIVNYINLYLLNIF